MKRVLNLTVFFKDRTSNGKICYSKEWLDCISKLTPEKLLELRIFLLCASEGVKYSGGKKTYTNPRTNQKVRYVNVMPEDGIRQTIIVPEFPGFDQFMCQLHIGTVDLSLDEITDYAKELKALAENEESKEQDSIEIVKSTNKITKADKA